MSGRDPVDGLLLIAATRRAAYRAKPPRMFLDLIRGRLGRMFGFDRSEVAAMLPDTLAAKEERLPDGYDLPPSHYAKKTELADKLCACLLYHPECVNDIDLKTLRVGEVRGHALSDILLSARAFGEPMEAKIDLEDLRQFIAVYQSGECWPWYVGMYVQQLRKLLTIEAAFHAALM